MGALEKVAEYADVPRLGLPLEQTTPEVQFEALQLAEYQATLTLLERTYIPDWVADARRDTQLLDSQRFVIARIREKAEMASRAYATGIPVLAARDALQIPVDTLNDLLWFALLSTRHGMVPWAYALGRQGRTPALDREFVLRLGLAQAVTKIAESPLAFSLKQERDRRLGVSGLGLAPVAVAGIVVGVAAVALIGALAYIVLRGYEVYQFNQRWAKWCTDPEKLQDPQIQKWCMESGKAPPAIDPDAWKTDAVYAAAGLVAVVLAVQFLPQIVGRVKKARAA
jgi:hypothetical protein